VTGARWPRFVLLVVAVVVGVLWIANLPMRTRQGVDFVTSTSTLPLYLKALDFVQRDASYGRLARRIVGDRTEAQARALALFEWTRQHIRDTPGGFPIVDDHIWHIMVRGYGEDDQKADVFTTLATYVGVPSFWMFSEELPLSFAWINRGWAMFDVANGVVFRHPGGALVTAEDVARNPHIVDADTVGRTYRGRPYGSYFAGFRPPTPPDILRPEMQMLWPRVAHRAKRLVGLGRREWEE
jgi:hypothetical protein